jgi:apolipoprotein N-acyltransferase
VLRAIENRRALARCANTGISCFIDPYGNVDQRTPLYTPATIIGDCALNDEITFYTAHGDLLAWLCCSVSALTMVLVISRRKRVS